MGLFEDIAGLVETGPYETVHILSDTATIPVELASGAVDSLAEVRGVLPPTLDHNEADIALLNGQSVSLYGVEGELTWVSLLVDSEVGFWVHAFKYDTLVDYTTGSALQTPAASLRVT